MACLLCSIYSYPARSLSLSPFHSSEIQEHWLLFLKFFKYATLVPTTGPLHSHSFWFSQFSSVQSLSRVRLFVTPWTASCQAPLSITNSWSLLKLISNELVMPSNHLILCRPLLLLPSIFPNIRVFSNESALRIRWPKYWSFSFNISSSNEHSGLIFTVDTYIAFRTQLEYHYLWEAFLT